MTVCRWFILRMRKILDQSLSYCYLQAFLDSTHEVEVGVNAVGITHVDDSLLLFKTRCLTHVLSSTVDDV
jgi:hypothetical protein